MQSSHLLNRVSERTNPDSHVPYSVLTSDEMQTRITKLHKELHKIQKQCDRLKGRLSVVVEKHGITVDEEVCDDLKHSEGSKMMEKVECNSFQHSLVVEARCPWHEMAPTHEMYLVFDREHLLALEKSVSSPESAEPPLAHTQ